MIIKGGNDYYDWLVRSNKDERFKSIVLNREDITISDSYLENQNNIKETFNIEYFTGKPKEIHNYNRRVSTSLSDYYLGDGSLFYSSPCTLSYLMNFDSFYRQISCVQDYLSIGGEIYFSYLINGRSYHSSYTHLYRSKWIKMSEFDKVSSIDELDFQINNTLDKEKIEKEYPFSKFLKIIQSIFDNTKDYNSTQFKVFSEQLIPLHNKYDRAILQFKLSKYQYYSKRGFVSISLSPFQPILKDINFPQYFDATVVYQNLDYYFGNYYREVDPMPDIKMTDKQKIESKGFDAKLSFRKSPTKVKS